MEANRPEEGTRVCLEVKGVPPSFKNRKRIYGRRLVTDPKVAKRMRQIEDSFVSQLLSASQRPDDKTWTASQAASWIAWYVPEDDAWQFLPHLSITGSKCKEPSLAGASVTIESL